MNFTIHKKDLSRALSLIQSISGRKTTLPILTHALLEVRNRFLYLTGTDLEIGIREEVPAVVQEEGKASVSAKKIYEIIRELPEEEIHIEKKENHWITIQCGKSVFNLAGLDPEEFPVLPTHEEQYFTKLATRILLEMIEKTAYAASTEESRYHLNGVLFTIQKGKTMAGLRMVATDGHRLSLIDREGQPIRGMEKGIIIPKKGVVEIKKVMAEKNQEEWVEIYFDPTHGFLKIGTSLMVIRLIDGEFPEYEQVIPKGNDKKMTLDKEKVYGCLRRVSTMATERGEGVKFSIRSHVAEFASCHQDFGDAREELDMSYEGPSLEIGFNSRYLMEALHVIDTEEVTIELRDEGSPGIIKPVSLKEVCDQLCIVMPMRI